MMELAYGLRLYFGTLFVHFVMVTSLAIGEETRMSPELLWRLGRLGSASISADGGLAAYCVTHYKLKKNKGTTDIRICNLDSGKRRTLLRNWPSVGNVQFANSPFGPRIFFVGVRTDGDDEKAQVWSLNPVDGGVFQVTHEKEGVANLKVSPTGRHMAFTIDVKLDKKVTEIHDDLPKANARIIDSLMFRHWDAWHDYKYTHLHVATVSEDGRAGRAKDLMKDMKVDCPVPPFGGTEQFAWSPDGKQIAYTAKIVDRWAESTDSDVYLVDIDDAESRQNITDGMDGYDNDPIYSPDGQFLAFHSMERPGFESDRNRIMVVDRDSGVVRDVTAGLDQTAHGSRWLPGGRGLLFSSEHRGTNQIFQIGAAGGDVKQVSGGRFNWSLVDVMPDGKHALVSFSTMERPVELAVLSLDDGTSNTISAINDSFYEQLRLPVVKRRWVAATDGKQIHCWVIYPPDFDPSQKWPLLLYCQGGPQGQIGQWFSYRWNFHLMAANGYVVVAPNRRGLPGFGRQWNDQISGDWGGQAMNDLLSAADAMLAEPYIDANRAAAIGASFGGYTVYWLMGHHKERFQCMIAHCGVFNLESMYGSTEELFFPNWDLGGPYWKSPEIKEDYDRFSPHRYVRNWKTPLLVVHGQKDFRVPVTQGIEAFTAAQVQGVPSRFLYFPEEGHWVLKPQNGVLWHRIFFDWLDRYCRTEQNRISSAQ